MHEEGYILFAHKALLLVPDLGDAARRVAGAILGHYNMKTGQCDPSIDRLAGMLGLNRATVMRATALLNDRKLIIRTRHGGSYHRTAYEPNFELFNSMVAEWDSKMKTFGGTPEASEEVQNDEAIVADVRPLRSQDCDFDSRRSATLTLRINSSNKLFEDIPPRARENHPPTKRADRQQGLGSGQARIREYPKPKVANRLSHQQIAEDAACSRLNEDLMKMGTPAYGYALGRMTPEVQSLAVAAEVRRRGAGVLVVREAMLAPETASEGRA